MRYTVEEAVVLALLAAGIIGFGLFLLWWMP